MNPLAIRKSFQRAFYGVILALGVIFAAAVAIQYLSAVRAPTDETESLGTAIRAELASRIVLCSRSTQKCEPRELFISYRYSDVAITFCGATRASFDQSKLVEETRAAVKAARIALGTLVEGHEVSVFQDVQPCSIATANLIYSERINAVH